MRKVRNRVARMQDRAVTARNFERRCGFGDVCGGGKKPVTFPPSAVEDYKEALDFDDKQEIKEGLERAQKLLKISQKRDYYKILGVSR